MKNWKTTFFGLVTIAGGVKLFLTGQVYEAITAIAAGITGIFAKDADSTNTK
jgi:hypothetical protein